MSESNSASAPDEAGAKTRAGLGGVVEAGLSGEAVSARGVLAAIGGWWGVVETFVPATLYLGMYLITRDARMSAIAPLAVALVFFALRLLRRQTVQSALAGLLGAVVCVAVTLFTGRGEDYYLPGFWINGAWVLAHAVSLIVGWPIIGLLLGFLRGSLTEWRKERALRVAARACTFVWIAVFGARLAVQLPLFFAARAGDEAAVDALGLARLFMGIPLFALAVLFTWVVLSRVASAVDDANSRNVDGDAAGDGAPSSDDMPGENVASTGENDPSA